MSTQHSAVIVGGGIVGLSTAFYLNKEGVDCVVVDPKSPGRETSFGNAGSVSVGNIFPQAMPGIMTKAMKMLMNPLAPLKVNWRQPSTVLPWIVQFMFAARRRRVAQVIDALTAINRGTADSWQEIALAIGAQDLVQPLGYLHVYSDRNTFENSQWERHILCEKGIRFDVLDRDGLLKYEPQIGEQFSCGVLQNDSLAVLDPGEFCARLARYLCERGVIFQEAGVSQIVSGGDGYSVVTERGSLRAKRVLIAAGVWSKRLLSTLGVDVPIIAARGYHLMFESQQHVVHRPTLWAERYMVLTPMRNGIRMTSIKELTTLDSEPQFRFIRRLIPEARKLFPVLRNTAVSEWMGNRPCTPDSLPILDKLPASDIYVASGHGHMGLTQGPISGKLMAQWMAKGRCDMDISSFSLQRFGQSA